MFAHLHPGFAWHVRAGGCHCGNCSWTGNVFQGCIRHLALQGTRQVTSCSLHELLVVFRTVSLKYKCCMQQSCIKLYVTCSVL